jgi:CheY-like chemotaxis protein
MTPTVLIVDDCADIARIIARHLGSAAYQTVVCTNGIAARELLAQVRPDCIVLDLMMPGLTGSELLHELRRNPATHDIPVVLVSARVGYGGTHFRMEADADYCVGKPFTKQQLIHAVRTSMSRKDRAA